ncbi:hypothetical protein MMC16_007029 [Acarospora aff. strigata]|nr:hypothetical protein [Acarospora aff. strigata]
MSFQSLSQELQDMIYEYALCPPEGLTIHPPPYTYERPLDDEKLKYKCIQLIAPALLRTSRQVYSVALPILYGRNVFSLQMSCCDALHFLSRTLPQQHQSQIKNLHLPRTMMAADDRHNLAHAKSLGAFLVDHKNMRGLEDITLVVPDSGAQYEWFLWPLYKALTKAFKEDGRLRCLRFTHQWMYTEDVRVYGIDANKNYIEDFVLEEEYRKLLDERRGRYLDCCYNARRDGTDCLDTLDAVYADVEDVWHRAGFTIERDSCRPGEQDTVLVLRRLADVKCFSTTSLSPSKRKSLPAFDPVTELATPEQPSHGP